MTDTILQTFRLTKTYGGIKATNDLNFNAIKNQVTALIGPNGAGKTTLVGQLTGEITPDKGSIMFKTTDITLLKPHTRALLGIARSFQISSVFLELTVLENVCLAIQAHFRRPYRLLSSAKRDVRLIDRAMEIVHRFGLLDRENIPAFKISYGERRQLEIAMAMAPNPSLLLLDEPMAGMGAEESDKITHLLLSVKNDTSIILVEHNMDTVFTLADNLTVMVSGEIIASGEPDEVREIPEVRNAYLGE